MAECVIRRRTHLVGVNWGVNRTDRPAIRSFKTRHEHEFVEGRVGFEPTTRGLKVPCSNH